MDRIPNLIEGKMIHYVSLNGEHKLAVIVKIWDYIEGIVDLLIFPNKGAIGKYFDNEKKIIDTWHWIE